MDGKTPKPKTENAGREKTKDAVAERLSGLALSHDCTGLVYTVLNYNSSWAEEKIRRPPASLTTFTSVRVANFSNNLLESIELCGLISR